MLWLVLAMLFTTIKLVMTAFGLQFVNIWRTKYKYNVGYLVFAAMVATWIGVIAFVNPWFTLTFIGSLAGLFIIFEHRYRKNERASSRSQEDANNH